MNNRNGYSRTMVPELNIPASFRFFRRLVDLEKTRIVNAVAELSGLLVHFFQAIHNRYQRVFFGNVLCVAMRVMSLTIHMDRFRNTCGCIADMIIDKPIIVWFKSAFFHRVSVIDLGWE